MSELPSGNHEIRPPVARGKDAAPKPKLTVPPILDEERKNPEKTKEKKSWRARIRALLESMTKEEMLGSYVSFAFHFFLFIYLAFLFSQTPQLPQTLLNGGFSLLDDGDDDGEGQETLISTASGEPNVSTELVQNIDTQPLPTPPPSISDTDIDIFTDNTTIEPSQTTDPLEHELQHTPIDLLNAFTKGNDGFESRNADKRGKRGGPGDPTQRSEEAVEAGLRWLASHQDRDGGWSFDLGSRCSCTQPGRHSSRNAATAVALLPFLGAGYTHLDGQYRETVRRGLNFLLDSRHHVEVSTGMDYRQGSQGMYSQGLATIVLCEAYGMTRGKAKSDSQRRLEEKLAKTAQGAVRFIENAQDTMGHYSGGWRYRPNSSPGDLSVTGWQALALKSAVLAGLEVKSTTLSRMDRFLDHTNYDNGTRYNYLPLRETGVELIGRGESIGKFPDSEYTCTAIGLLLRMYLGRGPGHAPLDGGINLLDEWGALKTEQPLRSAQGHCNLYYAYYGTLALHHYGGSAWTRWFPELREFLIDNQSSGGHESGSWFFSDPYCDTGGRLLNTSLAVMILEVRYRYMPLYDGK